MWRVEGHDPCSDATTTSICHDRFVLQFDSINGGGGGGGGSVCSAAAAAAAAAAAELHAVKNASQAWNEDFQGTEMEIETGEEVRGRKQDQDHGVPEGRQSGNTMRRAEKC